MKLSRNIHEVNTMFLLRFRDKAMFRFLDSQERNDEGSVCLLGGMRRFEDFDGVSCFWVSEDDIDTASYLFRWVADYPAELGKTFYFFGADPGYVKVNLEALEYIRDRRFRTQWDPLFDEAISLPPIPKE